MPDVSRRRIEPINATIVSGIDVPLIVFSQAGDLIARQSLGGGHRRHARVAGRRLVNPPQPAFVAADPQSPGAVNVQSIDLTFRHTVAGGEVREATLAVTQEAVSAATSVLQPNPELTKRVFAESVRLRLVENLRDDIVRKWVDFFVYNKTVSPEIITRKLQ